MDSKHVKWNLLVVASTFSVIFSFICFYISFYLIILGKNKVPGFATPNKTLTFTDIVFTNRIPIGIGFLVLGIILFLITPFLNLKRQQARDEAEYDEDGVRKDKANFSQLSKAEREQIERQLMIDRQRILPDTLLKSITHTGPEDSVKALNDMIALDNVKLEVEKMKARMEFELGSAPKGKKKRKLIEHDSVNMFFMGSPGVGKAQPLYSKVLTPNGFVKMGDLKVGDIVISGTGNTCSILGIYPQGEKDIYEITFDDGSKCRCSDEHLWKVQSRKDRQNSLREDEPIYSILTLNEIKDNLRVDIDQRKNFSIDIIAPINYSEKDYYIHPYLMGLLLGDGCLQQEGVSISLYDEEIREYIYEYLPSGYSLSLRSHSHPEIHDYSLVYDGDLIHASRYQNFAPLNYELEKLGLRGKKSDQKFIPKNYMIGSYNQRMELLRGLLDTDGYVDKRSVIEYCTTSGELATNIIDLVQSLGGVARMTSKIGAYRKKNGEKKMCKKAYRIHISFGKENADGSPFCNPFKLSRKANLYKPQRSFKKVKRYIDSVEYVGKEECQCIYIDDPSHLYITDNYIITHNTTVARILTTIFYNYGYIAKNQCIEVDGNFFNGLSIGESSKRANALIKAAKGGVLFIDEAYSLLSTGGQEVIATIVKAMEDYRDSMIFIFAGYDNEMRDLLNSNPGIESRVKYVLKFNDYNSNELRDIFNFMANEKNMVADYSAIEKAVAILEKQKKSNNNFGNARAVRTLLDKSIDNHAYNLSTGAVSIDDKYRLLAQDIQE